MTATTKSDSDTFASAEALQSRHEELLSSAQSKDESLGAIPIPAIKDFLSRAAATGAIILDPQERRAIQNILRFWAAELITRGESDWRLPPLAAPQLGQTKAEAAAEKTKASDQSPGSTPASPAEGEKAGDQELARSSTLVRIAASARQWRASGKDAGPGWLLTGKALEEAERFAQDDDDIRALVNASRAAETRSTRWKISALAGLVLLLVVWAGVVTWLWRDSAEYVSQLEDAKSKLEATQNEQVERLVESGEKLDKAYFEIARRGREQQLQLAALQEAAQTLRRLRDEGKINATDIPQALVPLITALDQAPSISGPGPDQGLDGYDATFLQAPLIRSKSQTPGSGGITISPPKLVPNLEAANPELAYDDGRPLHAINFSIVLSKTRRMPIFSAVNLQRSRVVPVVRVPDRFELDLRVPGDVQLSPGSFTNTGLNRGRLVSARDIAWGDSFPNNNPEAAGRIAYGLTNVMTNVVPRYGAFNRGLWADAERYARETFSPRSDRIIIFSGPVFAEDDATVGDIRVPQRFWKVLIATHPDNPASVFVEAYLMAQVGRDGNKIDKDEDFVPATYRVRVSAIERLTGLDFGDVVRAGDIASQSLAQPANPATQTGANLAAALRQAIGPNEAERRAAMEQLLEAIRSQKITEVDPRTFAEAIVTMAKSFSSLSPEARVNVLTLLAAIPKASWDMERWIDVKAAARRAVADAAASLGGCSASSQSCTLIATVKPNLDWPLASGRTVYVQFAGMVREDVKVISDKLRALDWSIPGEERTAKAAGYNEVRYPDNEDDRRAAELLAADLRALGRSGVRAKKISAKAKILEIWLSI